MNEDCKKNNDSVNAYEISEHVRHKFRDQGAWKLFTDFFPASGFIRCLEWHSTGGCDFWCWRANYIVFTVHWCFSLAAVARRRSNGRCNQRNAGW